MFTKQEIIAWMETFPADTRFQGNEDATFDAVVNYSDTNPYTHRYYEYPLVPDED